MEGKTGLGVAGDRNEERGTFRGGEWEKGFFSVILIIYNNGFRYESFIHASNVY